MDWQTKQRKFSTLVISGNQALEDENYEDALKIFQQALKLDPAAKVKLTPKLLKCYRKEVTKMKNKCDYYGMIQTIQTMKELDNSLENIKSIDYKNLGIAYFHMKKFEEAKKAFSDARELKPDITEIDLYLNKIKAEEIYGNLQNIKNKDPYTQFKELKEKEKKKKKKRNWF